MFAPALRAAEGDFAKTLTPDELQSAGLPKLSPEELSRLEALVERYKSGHVVMAKKQAEPQEAKPDKPRKTAPEWVAALITLQRTNNKPDKSDALESRIKGDFTGWEKRTLFRLENGQQWTQVNDDSYVYAPPLKSPKVKIFPASFGTFWMEVEGVNQRCRVKPVRME